MVSKSPPGKSVLPIEPLNRVSPVKTAPSALRLIPPLVCPGVCRTSSFISPNSMESPSVNNSSAGLKVLAKPINDARFCFASPNIAASAS